MSQMAIEHTFLTTPLNVQQSSVEPIEQILASSPSELQAATKLNLASRQLLRRDAQAALNYAHKARELAEKLQQKDLLAQAFANAGGAYFNLARYDKALDYGYRALQLFEELPTSPSKAVALQVIGCVNLFLGEYDQAHHYFQQAAEMLEDSKDILAYSGALMNIGSTYFHKGKYQEALLYALKAKSIREAHNDKSDISEILANIGATFHALGNSEEGIEWLKQSLEMAKQQGNLSVQITTLINLGEIYSDVDRNYKAIDALLESIELAKSKNEYKQYLWQAYLYLSSAYKKIEKYQEALEAHEQFVQIKEKVLGMEMERKIKSIELNYAIQKAKHEAEIELAQKKIKQLEEIVTMCAWSGKIQMDGKWVKIEEFLNKRFGIKVSHGISEEEAEKVFKQMDEEKQSQSGEDV